MLKSAAIIILVLFLFLPDGGFSAGSASVSLAADHPLINKEANCVVEYLPTPDGMINILLMGIDADEKGKDITYRIEESHTDTIIVLAVNPKEGRLDMISLPRDTMAYVPGTRGVYKLNCAINVGATRAGKPTKSPEGFEAVRDTVSWVLGGVRIDSYIAVDMEAMKAIGDAVGGIDFEVEMTYSGQSGKRYHAGMQHLNGAGIVDYFRARKNATVDTGSDLARTGRQRALLTALFKKLMTNQRLMLRLIKGASEDPAIRAGFYTDLQLNDYASMMRNVQDYLDNRNSEDKQSAIRLHVIKGTYRNAFGNWKFTFTDQEHRKAVVKTVYNADVAELKYVSYEHAKWLYSAGFTAVRHLTAAQGIRDFLDANPDRMIEGEKANAAKARFEKAFIDTQEAFLLAASNEGDQVTRVMTAAANELQDAGNALARLISYPKKGSKVSWKLAKYHDDDKLVNEIYVNFR